MCGCLLTVNFSKVESEQRGHQKGKSAVYRMRGFCEYMYENILTVCEREHVCKNVCECVSLSVKNV